MTNTDVNSEHYWDGRFTTDWEQLGGPSQSQFFSTIAIDNFPEWLRLCIKKNNFSFADWGCALGDGTDLLSSYLGCEVTGIDFSKEAITAAQKKYPSINFVHENWLNPEISIHKNSYDVLFTSNTLEHFHEPFKILEQISTHSNNLIIVMIPFMEINRIEEHFFTFRPENIPYRINLDFNLVWSKIISCASINNTYWSGDQIILIYAKSDFINNENLSLYETSMSTISEEAIKHKINLLQKKNDELKLLMISENEELNSTKHKLAEFEAKIDAIYKSKSWQITAPLRSIKKGAMLGKYSKHIKKYVRQLYRLLPVSTRSYIFKLRYNLHNKLHAISNQHNKNADWVKWLSPHEKIVIIPCSFEFDELVNQRPINAAKYFSNNSYKVIFVAWQWQKSEKLNRSNTEVYPNILQVSLYDFIDNIDSIDAAMGSIFILTFPADIFTNTQVTLRQKGFKIVYDIMDEWEEFHNVAQAPWYNKETENHCVLNADLVTAVAPSLGDKFQNIRKDILIIGNGFKKEIVGIDNSRIALTAGTNSTIGYFGHLTDAWFDWPLIIKTAKENPNYAFEIIGYGEPSWVHDECSKLSNIKLVGKVPPERLYEYASKWKIGIIPFKKGPLAEAVDPIKIYEYLYFGLPVVATGIEHIKRYPMTYFSVDGNLSEIINTAFIAEWNEQGVTEFLESATWDERFNQLMRNLNTKSIEYLYEN